MVRDQRRHLVERQNFHTSFLIGGSLFYINTDNSWLQELRIEAVGGVPKRYFGAFYQEFIDQRRRSNHGGWVALEICISSGKRTWIEQALSRSSCSVPCAKSRRRARE